MWPLLKASLEELFDWLLPAACQMCGKTLPQQGKIHLCEACRERFLPLASPRCPQCLLPHATPGGGDYPCESCLLNPLPIKRIFALGLYSEGLREAIHHFKYRNALGLQKPFAELLARELAAHLDHPRPDLLVPVPLHRKRLQQRGYNQALQLARELRGRLDIPLDRTLLLRTLDTPPQQKLPLAERQSNVRGAFSLSQKVTGKRVLLVDDVMTTGATVRSCAEVLLKGGAEEVSLVVLARAPRPDSHTLSPGAIHA